MQQKKQNVYFPLNQHKILTTRKIRKLKKIKKRKMQFSGAHLANRDYNRKKIEDKNKKNRTNLGNNLFQKIIEDENQLLQDINNFNNLTGNATTKINNNNINNNNISLLNGNFPNNSGCFMFPIIAVPIFSLQQNSILYSSNGFSNYSFDGDLIENHNNNNFGKTTFYGGKNRDEILFEIPANNGSIINLSCVNNSANNNNNLSNGQVNLNINDSEFFYDYRNNSNRNGNNPQNNNINNNNQSNGQVYLRSNDSEFFFDYPRVRNRNGINPQNNNANNNNNQSNDQINLRSNDSEFFFDYPRIRNRNIPTTNANTNIENRLNKFRFCRLLSSNGNRDKCIICYENFKTNQLVYYLPCSHLFHVDCLNREIKYRKKCPLCRIDL